MWLEVEGLSDRRMVDHAAARGKVRLRSGRVVTLTRWPSPRSHVSGRYCRLETAKGTQFTLGCGEVEAIEVDE